MNGCSLFGFMNKKIEDKYCPLGVPLFNGEDAKDVESLARIMKKLVNN